ncbi:MAG: hypothetical protein C0508_30500 [Cyanobacteria bacterium PR.023]|nr:hypothetical protein [Cyanobacteria bacterium PR.023]
MISCLRPRYKSIVVASLYIVTGKNTNERLKPLPGIKKKFFDTFARSFGRLIAAQKWRADGKNAIA